MSTFLRSRYAPQPAHSQRKVGKRCRLCNRRAKTRLCDTCRNRKIALNQAHRKLDRMLKAAERVRHDEQRPESQFSRTLRTLGFQSYNGYLRSNHWQDVKARQPKTNCVLCDSKGPLHLHHQTYVRLGNERAEDLAWLCATCHRGLHRKRGKLRVAGPR